MLVLGLPDLPTYPEPPSGRYGTYLPTYPARPAITTAVTSIYVVTFMSLHDYHLHVVRALFLARRRRRKNRMRTGFCALLSRASSPIRRGLPSLIYALSACVPGCVLARIAVARWSLMSDVRLCLTVTSERRYS